MIYRLCWCIKCISPILDFGSNAKLNYDTVRVMNSQTKHNFKEPRLKTGVENGIIWSQIGWVFGEVAGTLLILRNCVGYPPSPPPHPLFSSIPLQLAFVGCPNNTSNFLLPRLQLGMSINVFRLRWSLKNENSWIIVSFLIDITLVFHRRSFIISLPMQLLLKQKNYRN